MTDSARLERFVRFTIFGAGRVPDNEDAIERELDILEENDLSRPEDQRRQSAYVKVFEDMVNTIYNSEERHLLTDREWLPISAYQNLPYNSRYCLVRLLLLKPNHWYSVSSFERWKREVGQEGIISSMDPLCRPVQEFVAPETPDPSPVKKEEDTEDTSTLIDLSLDSDNEDAKPCVEPESNAPPTAGPSKLQEIVPNIDPFERAIHSKPDDSNLNYFCEDDSTMTIEELLNRMTVDQLKSLAKQNKCPPVAKRPKKLDYITSLLKHSTSQAVLGFTSKPNAKGKGKAPEFRQTQLPWATKKESVQQYLTITKPAGAPTSQQARLRKQVLGILGKCYRLNYDFFRLVRRMHIIAYRCTEHPPKLMIPALLTTFKKRTYPNYKTRRDPDIWPSRHHLLDYEKALELEALVDEYLEAEAPLNPRAATVDRRFVTPATPKSGKGLTTPVRAPRSAMKTPQLTKLAKTPKKEEDNEEFSPENDEEDIEPIPDSVKVQRAKIMVRCLDSWLLHSWRFHLELKHKDSGRPPSLQRFESGYIYTRLLRRSLQSLADLGEYKRELEIVETLLSQKVWQRGKRARLYERRAIILGTHLARVETKEVILGRALEGVRQALLDDDTHLVARPGFLRRLRRLEKQLKVPPEECAQCEGHLREAEEVTIRGKRIEHRASSLKLDVAGNVLKDKENASNPGVDSYFIRPENPGPPFHISENQAEVPPMLSTSFKRKGKSIWEGRNRQEVSVEECALQYYQGKGFKGFHAETSIMTTIWILLTWDIVYADIRGAFETAYQSAPLDIVDDSFYQSRKELFDQRLQEIREGKAAEIIIRHDTRHRPSNTWAIGVRWDICELCDLIEIVQCIGGLSLAIICRLFCEDYVGRSSGGPDLIIWNHEKGICKFVEVKGPGDTARPNQKLWFDSLLGAGIPVEICKVVDVNDVKSQAASTRKGKSKTPASSIPRKRKKPGHIGKRSYSESESEDERDYEKMDPKSEDELPQAHLTKRQRVTDTGS